ncbi:MAG TPA: hypothetical protein VK970_23870 [Candidatus Methylacidiphilales bacterium]|nr:hypothetical protein [Candidatus Methylacidiphilales bacterium]
MLIDGAGSPAWNMAVDEALLRHATAPVLRIYEWKPAKSTSTGSGSASSGELLPSVSIGYFQPTSVVPAPRPFVRRYTGGGLVDHERDVTYTIVLPREHRVAQLSTTASYELIHIGVRDALAAVGIQSIVVPCCDEIESTACFQKAVKFDVKCGDLKLAGAAQRRSREGFLHQGSVLLPPSADPALNAALRRALPTALGGALGFTPAPGTLTADEMMAAFSLQSTRYSTDEWNRKNE